VTTLVGRGWATVDLERASAELADRLAPGAGFEVAARSALLGARCLRGRARSEGVAGGWIVLLEPDTEGRLAGYLARFGEGWAATWTLPADVAGDQRPRWAGGPLGDERLVEATSLAAGPFRLLLSAATIDP
jgi:hypothetical protein